MSVRDMLRPWKGGLEMAYLLAHRLFGERFFGRFSTPIYSQEGEDMILCRLLGERPPGRYVDVGAHHPLRFSNTYMFYLKGWRGVNIDARLGLKQRFALARPGDVAVEAAVGARAGERDFYVFEEEALNSLDPAFAAERRAMGFVQREIRRIPVRPLREILAEHFKPGEPIDFFCIDVEALDLEVLRSNDWRSFRPEIIVVESQELGIQKLLKNPMGRALRGWGYELVAKSFYSCFFRRVVSAKKARGGLGMG